MRPDLTDAQILCLDVRLDYLIQATGIRALVAKRRLWALNNILAAMSRRWRPDHHTPIDPARELRMNHATRAQWNSWICVGSEIDLRFVQDQAVYATSAIIDSDVPAGWVRLILSADTRAFGNAP